MSTNLDRDVLTSRQILALLPGRDLDRLIAEKVVLGHRIDGSDVRELVPHYSTEIAAAWQLVEKVGLFDCGRDGRGRVLHRTGKVWCIQMYDESKCEDSNRGWGAVVQAETAPLAVCRAVLLAVLEGKP